MKKKLMECFTDTRQRHLTTVCKLVILFYACNVMSGACKYVHYTTGFAAGVEDAVTIQRQRKHMILQLMLLR